MSTQHPWIEKLHTGSLALQSVLGAILEAERRFEPPTPPLQRLHEITTSPDWEWLQPLYRLIADIDHALASADDLPASEAAAIGAHARELISGSALSSGTALGSETALSSGTALGSGTAASLGQDAAPSPEQAFVAHYRALLQADPAVTIAHAAAMKALKVLPAEPANEAERRQARQQWNERRRYLRTSQEGQRAS